VEIESYPFVLLRRGPRAEDYTGEELDETRLLAEQDPTIKAGRVAAEVMTWLTRKGSLG
jgi:hypothetical protein